jgi:hypothetical protein
MSYLTPWVLGVRFSDAFHSLSLKFFKGHGALLELKIYISAICVQNL